MAKRKVFMPGCALASYNPAVVNGVIRHLKNVYPDISIVQKCCGKPTSAIGQDELFHQRFDGLVEDIKYCEGEEVIVACQSCLKTLKKCHDFETTSLWELFPQIGLPKELVGKAKDSDVVFSIHDSCSVREYTKLHDGIRWVLTELGYKHVEPPGGYTKATARCCGFGGMVVPANPDVAKRVMVRRVEDFSTPHIVVYCAACRRSMVMGGGKAWHILDLVFGDVIYKNSPLPEDTLASPVKSWLNRHKSKRLIKSAMK